MRKKVFGRKLSREKDTRLALFRSLTSALVSNGAVRTTYAKAKAIQPFVESLVSLAKTNTPFARRLVLACLGNNRKAQELIFSKVAPGFSRVSGFTKITRLPSRRGDRSEMVRLEWSEKINLGGRDKSKKETQEKKKKRE